MTNAERAKRFKDARTQSPHGAETLAQVYAATGISASAISNLENPENNRVPSAKIVSVLAEHYGVNAAWLMGQTDSPSLNENSQALTNIIGFSPKAAEKPNAEAAAPAKTAAAVPAEAPAAKAPEAAPAEEKPAAPAVQPRDDGKPVNDPSKCIYCTLCAKKCPQEAITVDRKAKTWELNDDDCVCCGTCQSVCPKDAIIM